MTKSEKEVSAPVSDINQNGDGQMVSGADVLDQNISDLESGKQRDPATESSNSSEVNAESKASAAVVVAEKHGRLRRLLDGRSIPIILAIGFMLLLHRCHQELYFVVDTLGNFSWQAMVGLVGLGIYQAYKKRWKWCGVALLLAMFPLWDLSPFYLPAEQPAAGETQVRLLSLNVLYTNKDYDAVEQLVVDVDPDIICFVEFSAEWQAAFATRLPEYKHVRYQPRGGLLGNVIYSRVPFSPIDEDVPVQDIKLGFAAAKFDFDGQVVNLVNIHTSSPGRFQRWIWREEHIMDIERLAGRFSWREHVVMVGDFNCTSHSRSFRRMILESRMRDSRAGKGIQNSWPSWLMPLQICIDHVLVSEYVHVHGRRVERNVGSDHYPIVTDLSFNRPKKKK